MSTICGWIAFICLITGNVGAAFFFFIMWMIFDD
jgi:hypothetical protein